MKYITILDFEKGEIHCFPLFPEYHTDDFEAITKFIKNEYELEFSENNCQWIIQNKLTFQIH